MGAVLDVTAYEYITVFLEYTKGDETGLVVTPWFGRTSDPTSGVIWPFGEWTPTTGVNAFQAHTYKMTATGKYYITLYVGGIQFVKVTQGGSDNDGTPTGTIGASYTMTG
jgi:hypothetical protein